MKNRYIYICIKNHLTILLFLTLVSSAAMAQQGVKVQQEDKPALFVDPEKQTQQLKQQATNKEPEGMVLFPAKTLELVELNYQNARPYFQRLKADDLMSHCIKGMYLPAADAAVNVCDLQVAENFDKNALPPLDTDFNKELMKFVQPDLLREVFFCLSYLGISATASDFYIYYAAPYKAEMAAIQNSKLQGRELAWVIANDFKQSACLRQPIIYLDKLAKQKLESKYNKIN